MECGGPHTYEEYKRQTVPERSRPSGQRPLTRGIGGSLYLLLVGPKAHV
jgi:hypothetical protein